MAGSVQTRLATGTSKVGGATSSDLLNKMRVRNEVFAPAGVGGQDEGEAEEDADVFVSDAGSLELLKRIREYVMFECAKFGQATTKEIMDEFGPKLPPENSAKFRALLKSICDLDKKDGVGVWKLRQDFK